MILILSNKWDRSADFVVRELRRRGHDFLRLNTEDLVSDKATITLPDFHIVVSKRGRLEDLTKDVRVIWNRRPGKPFDAVASDEAPSTATRLFVNDQWCAWLEALQLLHGVTWINHPQANSAMENKIRQLWLASRLGFRIPETIISNDPTAARFRLEAYGKRLIAKALYSPLIEERAGDFFIFTNEINDIAPNEDDAIKISPCVFQEPLIPKIDYRVTVVGDTVMAVRIESDHSAGVALDWRTQKDGLAFHPCELPDEINGLCQTYVTLQRRLVDF